MHISEVHKMREEKEHLMRNGYSDYAVESPNSDHRFAENDGDTENEHLSLKHKQSHSQEKMPRIEEAYHSDERARSRNV